MLSNVVINMVRHASLCKHKVSLGCPGLELLDQKMHVSSRQIVWKGYVPIYIPITSVERDPSAAPTRQNWVSSITFT